MRSAQRRPDDVAARAARRFSTLGLASVTALIASGLVNAWYQVGAVPALIGTLYGRLLLVKLALFAAMIVIAVVNRGNLAPRVADADHDARRTLRRNALVEMALGLGVVVVVGRLGVTVPAAHETPLWPFEHTLSTLPMEQSPWIQLVLAAAGIVAFIAVIFLLKGILDRPPRVRWGTLAAIVIPAGLFVWLLVVPAHPTTYASSPVRYTTKAVAAGAVLYASNCSACHGPDGRGDGPAAGSPSTRPRDLPGQIRERSEGDLFWSIAHGIPGTAMPGFASRLTEVEIWNLIQFLDAQSAARNASAMSERVKPLLPIPAPDFAYERVGAFAGDAARLARRSRDVARALHAAGVAAAARRHRNEPRDLREGRRTRDRRAGGRRARRRRFEQCAGRRIYPRYRGRRRGRRVRAVRKATWGLAGCPRTPSI